MGDLVTPFGIRPRWISACSQAGHAGGSAVGDQSGSELATVIKVAEVPAPGWTYPRSGYISPPTKEKVTLLSAWVLWSG